MIPLKLLGVGLIGPGLDGWQASMPILKNSSHAFHPRETVVPIPNLLPPNERRRTTPVIKLALAAAEQAAKDALVDPGKLATVFASSLGDMRISDNLCRALASDEKLVSPTQFHNSVHNAPAGYWSIAMGSRHASTSLAASASSFPAALLETALQTQFTERPTLLVAYDHPAPFPLSSAAPLVAAFAVALVLQADSDDPNLTLTLGDGKPTILDNQALEQVRLGNPAARSLPLLQAIAREQSARVFIPYLSQQLILDLRAA